MYNVKGSNLCSCLTRCPQPNSIKNELCELVSMPSSLRSRSLDERVHDLRAQVLGIKIALSGKFADRYLGMNKHINEIKSSLT